MSSCDRSSEIFPKGVDIAHRRAHHGDMKNAAQNLTDIARNATKCPTCPSAPNPENFGGMCDPCDTAARERRARQGALIAQVRAAQGRDLSYEDKIIVAAGNRAAAALAR